MTAPHTPPARVTNPPAPSRGASDASGSTIRAVYGPSGTLAAGFVCLAEFPGARYCLRPKDHAPGCIAFPPFPRKDITRENPNFQKEQK
ncbi:MAG: hypothetical protein JWO98_4904 [Frankiales bacterium]|nr:hypothetical protein [Frankiales bacterium]